MLEMAELSLSTLDMIHGKKWLPPPPKVTGTTSLFVELDHDHWLLISEIKDHISICRLMVPLRRRPRRRRTELDSIMKQQIIKYEPVVMLPLLLLHLTLFLLVRNTGATCA